MDSEYSIFTGVRTECYERTYQQLAFREDEPALEEKLAELYPGEWVAVAVCELDPDGLSKGELLAHSVEDFVVRVAISEYREKYPTHRVKHFRTQERSPDAEPHGATGPSMQREEKEPASAIPRRRKYRPITFRWDHRGELGDELRREFPGQWGLIGILEENETTGMVHGELAMGSLMYVYREEYPDRPVYVFNTNGLPARPKPRRG